MFAEVPLRLQSHAYLITLPSVLSVSRGDHIFAICTQIFAVHELSSICYALKMDCGNCATCQERASAFLLYNLCAVD